MLSETDVLKMDLNAESVVLSACNSGGAGGSTGGDSLSALARSFFYAGARSLLASHWTLNDKAAARLVPDTLRRLRTGSDGGLAGSLRAAELSLLDAAGHEPGIPAMVANSTLFLVSLRLIGEGSGTPQRTKVAAAAQPTISAPTAREYR